MALLARLRSTLAETVAETVAKTVTKTVGDAVDSLRHSAHYTRHLLQGHRVQGRLTKVQADAVPVVLVHGFMATRGTMEPMTRRLQRDGRVVFSYVHGNFNLAALETTASALMQQIRDLCQQLGVRKVDVVGYSMGGLLALHAVKCLGGQECIRKVVMLGAPLRGSWLGFAGVATVGIISPAAWQLLPGSSTLAALRARPLPPGVQVFQLHAQHDVFCPNPGRLPEVAPENYVVIAGGHSTLVVADHAYAHVRAFLGPAETAAAPVESPINFASPGFERSAAMY